MLFRVKLSLEKSFDIIISNVMNRELVFARATAVWETLDVVKRKSPNKIIPWTPFSELLVLLELLGEEQAKVVTFLSNCSLDAMVELMVKLMVDDTSGKASQKQEEKGPVHTLFVSGQFLLCAGIRKATQSHC